jgi:Flp pilus assembly protein TadD
VADTFGWILTKQGDANRALPILEKASKQVPANQSIQFHHAYALAQAGRADDARTQLEALLGEPGDFQERAEAESTLQRLTAKGR